MVAFMSQPIALSTRVVLLSSSNAFLSYPAAGVLEFAEIGVDGTILSAVFRPDGGGPVVVREIQSIPPLPQMDPAGAQGKPALLRAVQMDPGIPNVWELQDARGHSVANMRCGPLAGEWAQAFAAAMNENEACSQHLAAGELQAGVVAEREPVYPHVWWLGDGAGHVYAYIHPGEHARHWAALIAEAVGKVVSSLNGAPAAELP